MSSDGYDAVCVGIVVADLVAPPLTHVPAPGELLLVEQLSLEIGGCASNTSVGLARLGTKVAVLGKVGNDSLADFLRHRLESEGVDISALRVSAATPTARTMIFRVVGEDRRFIHSVGANAEFRLEDIDLDVVARSRVLYVGGYLVLPGFDQTSLAQLFRFAQERGIKTVLDVAGPEGGLQPVQEVLPYTDVFLPNDDEGRILTGENDPQRQAEVLLACGAGTVIITMGGNGALALSREHALRASAFAIDVVDPSGGGDAFDAGFIFGLLRGWGLRRTLEFASAMGASACTKVGTTPGLFTRSEAEDFLSRNRIEITDL